MKGMKACVKDNPKLHQHAREIKNLVRRLPYYINNLGRIGKSIFCNPEAEISYVMEEIDRECFFGYYGSSPWSPGEERVLYLSAPILKGHPTISNKAKIICFDLRHGKRFVVGHTRAWNWQQGCMLRWLEDQRGPTIIYNDHRENNYSSVIVNIETGEECVIPFPYYTFNEKRDEALSLNFQRLHHFRLGYGYDPGRIRLLPPSQDGIFRLDMKTGDYELILSLNEVAHDIEKSCDKHWVNHLEYNKSATRVIFLHRYVKEAKRHTRMFTMNPDGSDLFCLCDSGYVSHYAWMNEKEILAWAEVSGERNYFVFTDKSQKVRVLGENLPLQDGHPSFSPDGRWLLTDTYPDRGGWKNLILYDIKNQKGINLTELYTPIRYNGTFRCDLHPRWDRKGNNVCFDSVHEGTRRMYVLDIGSITER